jgi:thiamine-monophosphate kinase
MENTPRTEISTLGEFGLIHHLTKNFELQHAFSVKGIGDDAAVIDNAGKMTVVSTDLLIEQVHFDLLYTPLQHLGYKSVVVNLSDIYAMNAEPRQITVSIAMSNRFSVEALEELYEGIYKACEYYKVDLVGGDTTSSVKGMVISITAIGEANEEALVYRNGARPGDLICVSGNLGAAYMGLQLLEREKRIHIENPEIQPDLSDHTYIVGRHLKPEARWDVTAAFAKTGLKPTAMIDLSDGLSNDLHHICDQSATGAIVFEKQLPIHEDTFSMATTFNVPPTTAALNGGEDYELLFTVAQDQAHLLSDIPNITVIGEIREKDAGILLETNQGKQIDMPAQGWNHMRKA